MDESFQAIISPRQNAPLLHHTLYSDRVEDLANGDGLFERCHAIFGRRRLEIEDMRKNRQTKSPGRDSQIIIQDTGANLSISGLSLHMFHSEWGTDLGSNSKL